MLGKTLIIGYGNPLRGDDGAGWHAAQALELELDREDVEVLARHQLTPELAEPISKSARVIFIDASARGEPGSFSCTRLEPAPLSFGNFTHHVNPAGLLALARTLFGHCPEAYVLAITGSSFGFEEALTPNIEAIMPQVITAARQLCDG